jgi:hypothetical protein
MVAESVERFFVGEPTPAVASTAGRDQPPPITSMITTTITSDSVGRQWSIRNVTRGHVGKVPERV